MKLNGRGLTGTIIYHALLLLLLIFAGLTYPDPPPEEEGILVNFGTDEFGLGDYEPIGDDQQAGNPDMEVTQAQEPVEEVVEDAQPVVETRQTTPPPRPVEVDQTQDVEETRVREEPKPTAEELERQRQAELERQRQAELERQRLEQERIAREEQERIERERQQQAERLNNLGREAFGNQGVGETEGSEGITRPGGNQGDPNGTPDADRYDTGGGLGDGISFGGLGSRRALGNLPKPNLSGCDVTQRIEVRVEVQVDQGGNVVGATVIEASYSNDCIWRMVEEAARKSKFSVDQNANYRQTGWIKYIITP